MDAKLIHNLIIDYFTSQNLLHVASQLKAELNEVHDGPTESPAPGRVANPQGSYLEALLSKTATPDIVKSLQTCFDDSDDNLSANTNAELYRQLGSDREEVTSARLLKDTDGEPVGSPDLESPQARRRMSDLPQRQRSASMEKPVIQADPLAASGIHGLEAHRQNREMDYGRLAPENGKQLNRVSSSRIDVVDVDANADAPFLVVDASPIRLTGDDMEEAQESDALDSLVQTVQSAESLKKDSDASNGDQQSLKKESDASGGSQPSSQMGESTKTVLHVPAESGGAEFVSGPHPNPRYLGSRKDSHLSSASRQSDTWSDDDDVGYRRVMEEDYVSDEDFEGSEKWGTDGRRSVDQSLDATTDATEDESVDINSFDRSTELEQSILDEIAANQAQTAQMAAELEDAGVEVPNTPAGNSTNLGDEIEDEDSSPDEVTEGAASADDERRSVNDGPQDEPQEEEETPAEQPVEEAVPETSHETEPTEPLADERETHAAVPGPPTDDADPAETSATDVHSSPTSTPANIGEVTVSPANPNDSSQLPTGEYPAVSYDDFYPVQEGDIIYDAFPLRIVTQRDKTGFEESSRFPITPNAIIAGRYQVLEYLGSAAFSDAVQCLDLATGELVCIKIIKNSKDFFDQSLDEVKLLQYINSSGDPDENNVLRMYDFFYHKEHLFIVCELLRDNLYEFSKYSRECCNEPYFTLPRLQRITKQCLWALKFIHSLNLVHCDLKPENILIKSYSRCLVKIIDFGSSCFVHDRLASYVQSRSYRAPEVILGLPWGPKIDMWSFGCILAELWTGKVLFQNDSIPTLLARLVAILGPVPDRMLREGRYSHKYFSPTGVPYEYDAGTRRNEFLLPKPTTLQARLHTNDGLFLDFITRLLAVDPELRPSATEALEHPWLAHEYRDE